MKQSAEKISEHILGSVKGLNFILKANFTRKKARTRRFFCRKISVTGNLVFLFTSSTKLAYSITDGENDP